VSGPVDWDAKGYDRLADPQEEWGREVIARLDLAGDETVLDAGCGSGRVTRHLLDRLPEGRVIGVDGAPSMIELARENLAEYGDRVELSVSDLLELDLRGAVDVVFSNATFHWILDHQRLFDRLFAALRPGGTMEAQCGGFGNVAEWKRAVEAIEGDERFAQYLRGMPDTHYFATPDDTRKRLERSGFAVERVWLENKTVQPSEPREFARVVGLSKHMVRVPEDLQGALVDAVVESMPSPLVLNYVRLNISAGRPA
jgi:trans-aconitate 2-methyltransferase